MARRRRSRLQPRSVPAPPRVQSNPITAIETMSDVTGPSELKSVPTRPSILSGPTRIPRIIFSEVRPSEDLVLETVGSSIASSKSRKGRGKARGVSLAKATRGGRKVPVTIPDGKFKPVGNWAAEFTTEVGLICRTWAPPTADKWAHVPNEDKKLIYQHILEKFDIDLDRPNVKDCVETMLMSRFRDFRYRLHQHYLKYEPREAVRHPPENMSQEIWDHLCEHFSSERFQKRSKANTQNRGKLSVNHIAGSKSFVRLRHDLRDPVTQEEPSRIDFYHHTHYRSDAESGSWVSPQAQQIYEQMTMLQSQTMSDGVHPLTSDEICDQVLGKRSRYISGLGHGERATSSSTSEHISRSQFEKARQEAEEARQEAAEARRRAEDAERRAVELAQKVEAQDTVIQDMSRKFDGLETLVTSLMSRMPLSKDIAPPR